MAAAASSPSFSCCQIRSTSQRKAAPLGRTPSPSCFSLCRRRRRLQIRAATATRLDVDEKNNVAVAVTPPPPSPLPQLADAFGFDAVSERELNTKGCIGMRRTKVVCTVGPACCSEEELERLAMGGMDVARLNMCHNTREWHREVIRTVHRLNRLKGFSVALMMDTEGSRIHLVNHGSSSSLKAEDGSLWLFTTEEYDGYRPFTVKTINKRFSEGIMVGDDLIIESGMAAFTVEEKIGTDLRCRCTDPGLLLPRAKLSVWRNGLLVEDNFDLPSLLTKDWDDIEFGISEGVDFISVSFAKDASDIKRLKSYLANSSAESVRVLAKIESLEALENLKEIVEASDGIMVARGDLGVQVPLENIPVIQEEITDLCRQLNKPVIIASQLLESMIEYPIPTRAEVSDISEAIRQHADALMLSGESAVGSHAEKALQVLCMTSERMELYGRKENQKNLSSPPVLAVSLSERIAEQICNCASDMANNLGVDAILVYTRHGHMASLLSRNRPNAPIFAFTDNPGTRKGLSLHWGVTTLELPLAGDMDAIINKSFRLMKARGAMEVGDVVLIVSDASSSSVQSVQVRTIS